MKNLIIASLFAAGLVCSSSSSASASRATPFQFAHALPVSYTDLLCTESSLTADQTGLQNGGGSGTEHLANECDIASDVAFAPAVNHAFNLKIYGGLTMGPISIGFASDGYENTITLDTVELSGPISFTGYSSSGSRITITGCTQRFSSSAANSIDFTDSTLLGTQLWINRNEFVVKKRDDYIMTGPGPFGIGLPSGSDHDFSSNTLVVEDNEFFLDNTHNGAAIRAVEPDVAPTGKNIIFFNRNYVTYSGANTNVNNGILATFTRTSLDIRANENHFTDIQSPINFVTSGPAQIQFTKNTVETSDVGIEFIFELTNRDVEVDFTNNEIASTRSSVNIVSHFKTVFTAGSHFYMNNNEIHCASSKMGRTAPFILVVSPSFGVHEYGVPISFANNTIASTSGRQVADKLFKIEWEGATSYQPDKRAPVVFGPNFYINQDIDTIEKFWNVSQIDFINVQMDFVFPEVAPSTTATASTTDSDPTTTESPLPPTTTTATVHAFISSASSVISSSSSVVASAATLAALVIGLIVA